MIQKPATESASIGKRYVGLATNGCGSAHTDIGWRISIDILCNGKFIGITLRFARRRSVGPAPLCKTSWCHGEAFKGRRNILVHSPTFFGSGQQTRAGAPTPQIPFKGLYEVVLATYPGLHYERNLSTCGSVEISSTHGRGATLCYVTRCLSRAAAAAAVDSGKYPG